MVQLADPAAVACIVTHGGPHILMGYLAATLCSMLLQVHLMVHLHPGRGVHTYAAGAALPIIRAAKLLQSTSFDAVLQH